MTGKTEDWVKNCPSATLSTTNPKWADPDANLSLRSDKPYANGLSYGTVLTSGILSKIKSR
jgi:hypothetical protein